MTTMYQRQRMRDRHEARAWHDSCVTEAQAVEAAQEEARRILAPWSVTLPALPAEAATEVGADDDAARGFVIALPAALLAWAVIAAGAVAFKFWPQIAAFLGFGPTT